MPIVQTVLSKITDATGALATGTLTVQPTGVWEWDNPVSLVREKVSAAPIVLPITAGAIVATTFAPTSGAGHDVLNAGYLATFTLNSGSTWTETWSLPAAVANVELANITLMASTAQPTLAVTVKGDPGVAGPVGFNFTGAWSAVTTYAIGDAVVAGSTRLFVSRWAGNVGNIPPTTPVSDVAWTFLLDTQRIDHVTRTVGTGAVGTTDTYTLWADVAGTVVVGTFTVLNGAVYIHPNHTGDVTSVGDGVTVISPGAVTLPKMAAMATSSILGRATAGTGVPEVLTPAQVSAILGLGTVSGKNIAVTGDAAVTEVVMGNDSRLSDNRVPVAHTHLPSEAGAEPANANIQSHILSTANPHSVTKTQVGLGSVDNTSDVNKPVSTAQQTALNLKANLALVSNVNNTSDTNKPVSAAQQTALDLKANLASPSFTGAPTAPTATQGANSTQLATTAYVDAAGTAGNSLSLIQGSLITYLATPLLGLYSEAAFTIDTNHFAVNPIYIKESMLVSQFVAYVTTAVAGATVTLALYSLPDPSRADGTASLMFEVPFSAVTAGAKTPNLPANTVLAPGFYGLGLWSDTAGVALYGPTSATNANHHHAISASIGEPNGISWVGFNGGSYYRGWGVDDTTVWTNAPASVSMAYEANGAANSFLNVAPFKLKVQI